MKSYIKHVVTTASISLAACSLSVNAIEVEEVATGLKNPWGIAFLPNGDALVTERTGGLRKLTKGGVLTDAISGLPEQSTVGQGGLMGLALHPQFADNGYVYVCLSVEENGKRGSEVHRGKLSGNTLGNVEPVFKMLPKLDKAHHFGCRVVFDNDGYLFISLGDRASQDEAQNNDNHIGTVVRLKDDGSVPSDNPFVTGKAPEIYTYGHRNVQGMAVHPETGAVWTHEHGPKGGDEINILSKGSNYGWPTITYGVNYNGSIITDKTAMEGMQQPLVKYVPSIAPSGMTFYTGDVFPEWQGDLFIGALKFRHLQHVDMENGAVKAQQELLVEREERIRDVVQGPEGALYILVDGPRGKVLRLTK